MVTKKYKLRKHLGKAIFLSPKCYLDSFSSLTIVVAILLPINYWIYEDFSDPLGKISTRILIHLLTKIHKVFVKFSQLAA